MRSASLPWRAQEPKLPNSRPAGSSAEASVPPDMVMSRSPGSMPGSQLPGRNPVLPDPSEAEAPSEPVAARFPEGTAFCRAGPRSEDPVSGLAGLHLARRPSGDRMGAVRNLPLSHTLKGKPVLVRYAAASSAALPSASAGRRSEDRARHPPGLWLGRLASVAGSSSRPHPEAVTLSESHQGDSACG